MKTFKLPIDRAHLGSRLHRSRGQSSVLESWRSLDSPQLPGPSFPAYESPPTANRRVHWWGFTTLQDGSRRILPRPAAGASVAKRVWRRKSIPVGRERRSYQGVVKNRRALYRCVERYRWSGPCVLVWGGTCFQQRTPFVIFDLRPCRGNEVTA